MYFTMTVDMDNEAFDKDPASELRKIFAKTYNVIKDECLTPGDGGRLADVNGNTIGGWEVCR